MVMNYKNLGLRNWVFKYKKNIKKPSVFFDEKGPVITYWFPH